MNNRNWRRYIQAKWLSKALIATLVIGILTNGLWEFIFRPLFNIFTELVIFILGNFAKGWYNSIFKNVATNSTVNVYIVLSIFVWIYVILAWQGNTFKMLQITNNDIYLKLYQALSIPFVTIFALANLQLIVISISQAANSHINKAISTVAPYVTDLELERINSIRANIKTAKDYNELSLILCKIGAKNKVNIYCDRYPSFEK